tara:strand:- start:95 stop:928 length:834 start_codon:yes stop_codon:yes gene_type:complete
MPKKRHNKKRNTAVLYETLLVELTKAVLSENNSQKQSILGLISKHFGSSTSLKQDLDFYRALAETKGLDRYTAEKLMFEVKNDREKFLDKKRLFNEQTSLINMMNRRLTRSVFSNFVPGYKSLATISQIFSSDVSTKNRVLLEKELMEQLVAELENQAAEKDIVQIDNLVYQTFTKKFNEKYGDTLLSEQKDLLNRYVMSFSDNGIALKLFVGSELERLREYLSMAVKTKEISSDPKMASSTKEVLLMVEGFKTHPVDEAMIKKVLKIQDLVKEIQD